MTVIEAMEAALKALSGGIQNCKVALEGREETIKEYAKERGEAMAACPWATHSTTHTEPKHCIAALASLIELERTEHQRNYDALKEASLKVKQPTHNHDDCLRCKIENGECDL